MSGLWIPFTPPQERDPYQDAVARARVGYFNAYRHACAGRLEEAQIEAAEAYEYARRAIEMTAENTEEKPA